jgi:hypothetical protein
LGLQGNPQVRRGCSEAAAVAAEGLGVNKDQEFREVGKRLSLGFMEPVSVAS